VARKGKGARGQKTKNHGRLEKKTGTLDPDEDGEREQRGGESS